VEAARFGTPIVASDLPVLREVAGDHATYFELGSPHSLAETLASWVAAHRAGSVPSSSGIGALSWEQSAEQLLDNVLEANWYRVLPERGARQQSHSAVIGHPPTRPR
jgi:glycosyltransferase involved in cell wall biosynthesis